MFTSFLEDAGGVLAKLAGVMGVAEPVLNLALSKSAQTKTASIEGTVNSELTSIGAEIVAVEGLSQSLGDKSLTPAQKVEQAAAGVAGVIEASPLLAGKVVMNQDAYNAAMSQITQGFAELLGSVKLK